MSERERILLIGNTPSPYTHKMLALLRYRQIPYSLIWANPSDVLEERGIAPPKVALLPTFVFADAEQPYAMVDSTPIIRKLESMYAPRSVIPNDPAIAFIDYLLEDFADEWCTKYMFHYRWFYAEDADNAGTLLPFCIDPSMPAEQQAWAKDYYSKRQIERLYVVGSNEATAKVIDQSYRRFLNAMEAHLANHAYMLGNRPAACDFGLYGQLSQLIGFDPTPRRIAHEMAPRSIAWASQLVDLSGLEPETSDWFDAPSSPSLRGLLEEVGRVYVPALLANAKALQAGQTKWEAEIDGTRWVQQSFPYQGKCLQWIVEQYQNLASTDRERVGQLLLGTGCEALFNNKHE